MKENSPEPLYSDIAIVLIHVLGIAYFGLLTGSFLCGFFSLPLPQAQGVLSDSLIILCFLTAVLAFCSLSLSSHIARRSLRSEQITAMALIAASTISFVYFQFYHDKWTSRMYMLFFGLVAVQSVRHMIQSETSFPKACVWYGLLGFIPAVHALLWPSTCRMPMITNFITYLALNAIGGFAYVIRVPERLAGLVSNSISKIFMHASFIMTASFFAGALLVGHESNTALTVDECKGWKW